MTTCTIGNDGVTEVCCKRAFAFGAVLGPARARFHRFMLRFRAISFANFRRVTRVATAEQLEIAYLQVGEIIVSDDTGHPIFADVSEASVEVIDAFA